MQKSQTYSNYKIINKRFQLKNQLLGKGNYGEIYLTVDLQNKNQIACKMISKDKLINSHKQKYKITTNFPLNYYQKLLQNQIKIWKLLLHPNITKFYQYQETKSNIYYFLQLCTGGSLLEKFQFIYNKNFAYKLEIFKQIVSAIQYMHSKNVCHHDLKPQNIIFDHNEVCKITDFGFAQIISPDMRQGTKSQYIVGSRYYMSPQMFNNIFYTLKTDIWSLGIILYEIMFNQSPYTHDSSNNVWQQERKEKLKFKNDSKIPKWVKKLILGMLAYDQNKRLNINQVRLVISKQQKIDKGI